MAGNNEFKHSEDLRREVVHKIREQGQSLRGTAAEYGIPFSTIRGWLKPEKSAVPEQHPTTDELLDHMKGVLLRKKAGVPVAELAHILRVSPDHMPALVEQLRGRGANVHDTGEVISITEVPEPGEPGKHVYVAPRTDRGYGYYKFGYLSDNHYGSKYAREDVTEELFRWFEREGVDRVFQTGNYIDGEIRFNKHDIFVHGMQNQIDYFCRKWPKVPGLKTYFVSGDDHEGWYGQREGVDIGWLTERTAIDKFHRDDLVHLGFVDAFVKLQHPENEDAWAYLLASHPGGGSAYATSYAPQKVIEALQGGEKPAVMLFGHWHKIFDLMIRGVIALGGGCCKDLDPFGRKNKLAYHIGGMVVELWQHPVTGHIERWRVEKMQFFDRSFHNAQFAYTGTERIMKGF